MTDPMQELNTRSRRHAAEWRRRGKQLKAAIVNSNVTANDGLTQLRLSASGEIQAIGFAESFSSKSMIKMSTSVMRVQGALTDSLGITDGVERRHMRNIRLARNVAEDDPDFPIEMCQVTIPPMADMGPYTPPAGLAEAVARMAEEGSAVLRPYMDPDAPDQGYNEWARARSEAVVRATIEAVNSAREHQVVTEHLTVTVDRSGRLSSVKFRPAIGRLSATELATVLAEAITEGLGALRIDPTNITQEV